MLIFFIILSIALAGWNAYLYNRRVRAENREQAQYENSQYWYQKWQAYYDEVASLEKTCDLLRVSYRALEQGRDEESEAYEQQYLSFMETIGKQAERIEKYAPIFRDHMHNCLPNVLGMEALRWWFDDYTVANPDTPIYDQVIEDHAAGKIG